MRPLPFLYESTGVETWFTNGLDPDPTAREWPLSNEAAVKITYKP